MQKPEKKHIIFQNIPDVLDPGQTTGTHGRIADLVMHLVARATHLGLNGDRIIISSTTPRDYLAYLKTVTGQNPDFLEARTASPLFTNNLLQAINPAEAQGMVLDPYIQWKTVGDYSQRTGIPMAYTPAERVVKGVVRDANNKALFRKNAPAIEMPIVPNQHTIQVDAKADIVDAIQETSHKYHGAFVQADLSGGGVGNVDIRQKDGLLSSSKLGQDMDKKTSTQKIGAWAQTMEEAGCKEIIVAPFMELKATHTVSGFVPASGEPFDFGVFGQMVHPVSYDYLGYEWPGKDPYIDKYGTEMRGAASRWLKYLQGNGYIGASDVDFLIGYNPVIGEVLAASESNTRWDSFRFALQYAAMRNGWNLRTLEGINTESGTSIKAIDHTRTTKPTTTEILNALKDDVPLFGVTNDKKGVIVMVPPRADGKDFETAYSVIADSHAEAAQLFEKTNSLINS
jgi:hypothetical protein